MVFQLRAKTSKVAVSVPKEKLQAVEQWRHTLGLTRSAVFTEALSLWLRQKEEQKLEERYLKGYQRKPERVIDVEPLFRTGLSSFTPEHW